MVSDQLLLTAVTSLPMLIGAAVIYKGYSSRQQAAVMEETETTPIANARTADGLVQLEGTAQADGDLSTAVMLDAEGVAVTTSVERRDVRNSPGDQGGKQINWNSVYDAGAVHDFSIADDTGTLPVVVPEEGELSIATQTITVGKGEEPPAPVQRLIDAVDGLEADPNNVRRYREGVITEGESLYGLGEVVTDGDGKAVFSGDNETAQFVISDRSEDSLVKEKAGGGVGAYVLGGFFFLMGAGFTALIWLV
jgi:hypothetical protein